MRMNELKTSLLRHLKSILRIPRTTSTGRLLATLGITSFKYSLQLQLARTVNKYTNWFGELPTRNIHLFRALEAKFELNLFSDNNFDFKLLNIRLNEKYTHMKAVKFVNHRIPLNYSSKLRQLYMLCDGRDSMLVKYFCNIGFFRRQYRETCQHCGEVNSREHAVDECSHYEELRNEAKTKLSVYFRNEESLSTMLSRIYFGDVDKERNKDLVPLLKKTICRLYTTQKREEEKAGDSS
jgi:hypothetical protein